MVDSDPFLISHELSEQSEAPRHYDTRMTTDVAWHTTPSHASKGSSTEPVESPPQNIAIQPERRAQARASESVAAAFRGRVCDRHMDLSTAIGPRADSCTSLQRDPTAQ